jgi:hypothetical protein
LRAYGIPYDERQRAQGEALRLEFLHLGLARLKLS